MTGMNPTLTGGTVERRSRRGLLWIAGALAAVLLGGSTFALWSANVLIPGAIITAGNLNLTKGADTAFYDVSGDRSDETTPIPGTGIDTAALLGHTIDPGYWMPVPGDKVAAVFDAVVTLEGDNMVAKLSSDGFAATATDPGPLDWTYAVYKDNVEIVAETALPTDGTLMYLSAPGANQGGQEDANGTTVLSTNGTEDLVIVLFGTFPLTAGDAGQATVDANGVFTDQGNSSTGTREGVSEASVLSNLILTLEQVRDTGVVFKKTP